MRTKEPEGIRWERSRLATGVVKEGIMLMNVGYKALSASTVRNRVTLPEIAVLQKRRHQQMPT
ncbi:hypothetical protein A2U01_0074145 [Trifolium medium]|uniref:Uncharacterized protein n=1 Tax=Trifolium medium TaxID=97028 RepID=A0A392SW65_9FABA|nr:hypothetical protein [Trifolium medium]